MNLETSLTPARRKIPMSSFISVLQVFLAARCSSSPTVWEAVYIEIVNQLAFGPGESGNVVLLKLIRLLNSPFRAESRVARRIDLAP